MTDELILLPVLQPEAGSCHGACCCDPDCCPPDCC